MIMDVVRYIPPYLPSPLAQVSCLVACRYCVNSSGNVDTPYTLLHITPVSIPVAMVGIVDHTPVSGFHPPTINTLCM